ncbi:MAG: hypothetical protein LBL51_06395 [Synergistaceae bacterium]|jgi:hypothetical protein|nr:hypothetical protein [Synergistaceae bacterium]
MAQISDLNVQVNQNQFGQSQAPDTARSGAVSGSSGAGPLRLPVGTRVEGQVLSRNADGSYTVRLNAQGGRPAETLLACATLELIVGERFRAVWDSPGADKIPILRLSQDELSLLAKMPQGDRDLAGALLARGLPLSGEVLHAIREAWRRMGGKAEQLSPLLELWARALPMTRENVQTLSWYMSLSGEAANEIWARVRKELKDLRERRNGDPADILREMREGDGETAKFLRGHSLLLRAPRDEVNPALLGAPLWPTGGMAHVLARVFVGRVREEEGRRYWQMGFSMEGSRLGFVGGDVESDGRSYNLNLYAEQPAACELLRHRRHAIRKELEGVPLALQFIGIARLVPDRLRRHFLSERGLDITV